MLGVHVVPRSGVLKMSFLPSQPGALLSTSGPCELSRRSSRFCPPVCYQLSQAGISSLLRSHLPPHTASVSLESPLAPSCMPLVFRQLDMRLPQLRRVPCDRCHPQPPRRSDQEQGFTLQCTLTHLPCRIRFAFAMYRSLPIASFRPCRCQQRPCDSDCLPPGRGDTHFFQ